MGRLKQKFPDAIFYVVHAYYDIVFEVNRDQTMFCAVHVDYHVFSKVIFDQTIF